VACLAWARVAARPLATFRPLEGNSAFGAIVADERFKIFAMPDETRKSADELWATYCGVNADITGRILHVRLADCDVDHASI
jgi:hypothetical protein